MELQNYTSELDQTFSICTQEIRQGFTCSSLSCMLCFIIDLTMGQDEDGGSNLGFVLAVQAI